MGNEDEKNSKDEPSVISIDDQDDDDDEKPLYILAEEFEDEPKKTSPTNKVENNLELTPIPTPMQPSEKKLEITPISIPPRTLESQQHLSEIPPPIQTVEPASEPLRETAGYSWSPPTTTSSTSTTISDSLTEKPINDGVLKTENVILKRLLTDFPWFFPLIAGLFLAISPLTPAAYVSFFGTYYFWAWGSTAPSIGATVLLDLPILIISICFTVITILCGTILIYFSYLLFKKKAEVFVMKKIIFYSAIISLTAIITWVISIGLMGPSMGFFNLFWTAFSPGFGTIGPFIGSGLLILFYIIIIKAYSSKEKKIPHEIPRVSPSHPPNSKFCRKCGIRNISEADFCQGCGEKFL